jgi:CRP-like cAMP-binding protein
MDIAQARQLLSLYGWLAREHSSIRDAILNACTLKIYAAGDYVFHASDETGGIYGAVDGGFGILVPASGDRLCLAHVIRQGVWFGHGPVLTGLRRSLTFRAVEPSHALVLPRTDLMALLTSVPDLRTRLAALSESNFSIAMRIITDLLLRSGSQRVAATLVRISSTDVDADRTTMKRWPVRLSQQDIGAMSNVSRDRVNRSLASFARKGWISSKYMEIVVEDIEALERFAAQDRTPL